LFLEKAVFQAGVWPWIPDWRGGKTPGIVGFGAYNPNTQVRFKMVPAGRLIPSTPARPEAKIMETIFNIVAGALRSTSRLTGLSYNEINVIAYYVLIPMTWAALLDKTFHFHWVKVCFLCFAAGAFLAALLLFGFSRSCDRLFNASVVFLASFRIVRWNYVQASVVICVVFPIAIYTVLVWLAFFKT
jgi:hypothetical protein